MRMTPSQIEEAKKLRKKGLSYAKIAEKLKVPEHSVYYALNREKLLEYHRKYFQKWKEKHKGYMKRYLKKWREKHPDYFKKWREKHPDYFKKYRERKKREKA